MSAKPSIKSTARCQAGSPFELESESAFQAWKQWKLQLRGELDPNTSFRLDPTARLDDSLVTRIERQLEAFNFVRFETDPDLSRADFLQLNQLLGLNRIDTNPGAEEDAVTLLQCLPGEDHRSRYIPYTDRAMNWHTDGYYNPPERSIRAFSLFCVSPADEGGENFLLDHEYVYLLLRDSDRESIAALMAPDMMRVPANELDDPVSREEQGGPVFAVDPDSGGLQMRFTSRPRHLIWKDDAQSQRARDRLREILHDSDAILDLKLERGQGMSCNNILHGRHAYQDTERATRLFYRARYLDSIDPRQA